ncbi:MAG: prolyl oligopeptidase family serine peptidase [Simkaniaceae bacterium]|nr:prolyl oligopeptidase family serine peptidase [Simkaniaceae bacterium]
MVTCLLAACVLTSQLQYPKTPKTDVVEIIHGQSISDPYRWLENEKSPDVKAWVLAENDVTNSYLNKIPLRKELNDRLHTLEAFNKVTPPLLFGNYAFYAKQEESDNQPIVYVAPRGGGEERVLIDPNLLNKEGLVSIVDFKPSWDGKHVAYTLAKSGSDWTTLEIVDTATGKQTDSAIEWGKFTSIAWSSNGFFYTRPPSPKDDDNELTSVNRKFSVYYHTLGTNPEKDSLVYSDESGELRLAVQTFSDMKHLVLYEYKSGFEISIAIRNLKKPHAPFIPLIPEKKASNHVIAIRDKIAYVATYDHAPKGKVVAISLDRPDTWRNVIDENRHGSITDVWMHGDKFIVQYVQDVAHRIVVFSQNGTRCGDVPIPKMSQLTQVEVSNDSSELFYSLVSFTTPPTVYRYDIKNDESEILYKPKLTFDTSSYETKQFFYKSRDGTQVPIYIVRKKGVKKRGRALLYAYGGFNHTVMPRFSPSLFALLEQGCTYAIAGVRGGSEYGGQWPQGGMLENKQNVFDDFIAAGEFLVDKGYTTPNQLGIHGGSNGGLLVAAVANQRPDLFAVALPEVGVMDMLRFDKFTIGWAWISEYGNPDDPKHFKNLLSYSPIHNIAPRIYPATLVTTADHDDRVVPSHSYKYIATLQNTAKPPHPYLIRIDTNAGHGNGISKHKRIAKNLDLYSFFLCNTDDGK